MEFSPYSQYHKFKRAEGYRNRACTMVLEARSQGRESVDRWAFLYLHEALTDLATGLFDLMEIPYNDSWPLSRYMLLLYDTIPNLPPICRSVSPFEYDRLHTYTTTEQWSTFSGISKELVWFAAHFNGESEPVWTSGRLITMVLHLLERYSDIEIAEAIRIPSDKPGLDWLDSLTEDEKNRVNSILRSRQVRAKGENRLADMRE